MKTLTNNLINHVVKMTMFMSLFLLAAVGVHAQSYQVEKITVKGGGGTSRGGEYEIRGNIGLTDKSPAMNNDEYAVTGGFVALFVAVQSPDAPTLNISVTATNTVVISWAASSADYVLEQSAVTAGAPWSGVGITPVAAGKNRSVVLQITAGNKFFRLRKP